MIDTIITGLVLMSVSGLTFIAYNHYESYEKIHNVLYFISFLIFACIMAWDLGLSYAHLNLVNLIQKEKIDTAHKTIENLQVNFWITVVSYLAVVIYLNILNLLPYILKNRNNEKPK